MAFVIIENRIERGTVMGSVDGSARRTFNMPTAKMIVEPGSTDQLVLGGIPYHLCKWVNDRFPSAEFGYPCYDPTAGDFTDELRATWCALIQIAEATNRMVDRKRKGPRDPPQASVVTLQPRAVLVSEMAEHLVAAILHGGLDTSNDTAVIECLRRAPPCYHCRKVLDHMDDALLEAKQMLVACEMSGVG